MSNDVYESLNILANAFHQLAKVKGWHERPAADRIGEFCANLHGEVSELWEAYRRGTLHNACDKPVELTCLEEELADIVIRALDMGAALGVDLAKAVEEKHRFNAGRSYRHHGKLA